MGKIPSASSSSSYAARMMILQALLKAQLVLLYAPVDGVHS
jgi:hypothetical protein